VVKNLEKKQFSTYDEQITFLEGKKDLIITDKEYARRMLLKIGYFSLINGYKEAFKESVSNQFQKGTTSMWST
jgi:abortive infection bacteriophage resistance protein